MDTSKNEKVRYNIGTKEMVRIVTITKVWIHKKSQDKFK